MTFSKSLTGKTGLFLILMVAMNSWGNILLRKGMQQTGPLEQWSAAGMSRFFFSALTSGTIWLGIGCLLVFFITYLSVLSWADYSYVSPATALRHVVVASFAYAFLGEGVPGTRWAGIALIVIGVVLVGRTRLNTTPPRISGPQKI